MCGKDRSWCPVCTPLEEWTDEQKELIRSLSQVDMKIAMTVDSYKEKGIL